MEQFVMSLWGYNEQYVSAVVSMAAGVISSKEVFDSRRCRRSIEDFNERYVSQQHNLHIRYVQLSRTRKTRRRSRTFLEHSVFQCFVLLLRRLGR